MKLNGLHHITAITANAAKNREFYEGLLGMRLVKKTVNQDDLSAYHLFYGDASGNPGTELTFFEWPLPPERRGTDSAVRTSLKVRTEADLRWWTIRFTENGVKHQPQDELNGQPGIDFEDPEGQRLRLIVDEDDAVEAWAGSTVPAEHQIFGLGPVHMRVADAERSAEMLVEVLGMKRRERYLNKEGLEVEVYQMGGAGAGSELHLIASTEEPPARQGAGGVHHIAFRTTDSDELEAWSSLLKRARVPLSGPIERYYFRSLYFREPNRVLFEIATDGPGFTVDEPLEKLGQSLSLPPFLEPKREEITAGLKPI